MSITIAPDTKTFAVGPWELDIAMARRLGYNEAEILNMCEMLAFNSRAYNNLHELDPHWLDHLPPRPRNGQGHRAS